MDRRDALGRIALLMGGAVIGAEFMLSGCKPTGATDVPDLFTADNTAYLNEIADTILPTTPASPGAKAANVGAFIAVMVRDCYTPENQKTVIDGLSNLNEAAKKKFGSKFMDLSAQQKTDLLVDVDKEQKAFAAERGKKIAADMAQHKGQPNYKGIEPPSHYFTLLKQTTLLGYFTSEIGATKALRYIAVPGHYDGNVPYKKGDKAWAT